ncbi:MAG TPA: beta-propeller fold lactonase family protein [Candidatus Sulfotelmatobacter sp.]|nr:beta-propeller fold lactonase family protein [Candidatus Sulfotelmatobacter sp.]
MAQFQLEGNGTLTALNPPALASVLPNFLAVDPTNQYLFVPGEDFGTFSEFGIGTNGNLAPTPAPAAAGNSVAFTPSGEFAIIVSPFDNTVTSYRLEATGALSAINTVATGRVPWGAVVDGSGRFAYVANLDDDTISEYTISRGGVLAPVGSISVGGFNPSPLVVSPQGFLYCRVGNPGSGSVADFAINPFTGALTFLGTYVTSIQPQGGPSWISFDLTGRNAYIGNTGGIAQFRVNRATGALISNGTTVTPNNGVYLWGGVDPSGRFLFGAGAEAGPDGKGFYGTISRFIINGNGRLTPNGSVSLGANTIADGFAFAQR